MLYFPSWYEKKKKKKSTFFAEQKKNPSALNKKQISVALENMKHETK